MANMQIPYSFLEKSANKQFKDLAFFQILKRKGPYIERSLMKIENDLFYKHKLSGVKMNNVSFVKEIRLTLAAYEVIVNEIKNDFLMTELDSLGDSIHRLFVQMISIINFFSIIVLKKQKLASNDMKDVNLEELREKQQVLKKMQEQQKARMTQQKQKQNDRLKQLQKLKYNVRELFKLEVNSDKQNKLIQSLWKAIVSQNKNSVKQCMKIKDSQLNRIIKDSTQYLYKNHTQLDNIVRLTKQDILQSQKTLTTFTDKTHLIEQNELKINHMKSVAKEIIEYIREKVYDKKHAQVQTTWTNIDPSRPYMTVKELDERRKMQVKIKNYQKTTKERQVYVEGLEKKLKEVEDKLRAVQDRGADDTESDDDEDQSNNTSNHKLAMNKPLTMARKSKHNNFNSFKINPTSLNKFRQASFTIGKKFSKLSKVSTESPFYQKTSNRSSSTSKDFNFGSRISHYNNKSTRNLVDRMDSGEKTSQHSTGKKFYKVRESNLVAEAKSFEEISRRSEKSRAGTLINEDVEDHPSEGQGYHDRVSIDDLKSVKDSMSVVSVKNPLSKQQVQQQKPFTISQTFKLTIRPQRLKRYLQSTYKHPLSQEKGPTHLLESRLLKSSKLKKSTSQHDIQRYFFEPLNAIDRFSSFMKEKQYAKFCQQEKKKVLSATASPKPFEKFILKEKQNQSKEKRKAEDVPQLSAISFVKLKNQKMQKSRVQFSFKQNPSILKGCIKSKMSCDQNKKQLLKKSSSTKQTVSFGILPGSEGRRRKSLHQAKMSTQSKKVQNQALRVTIGEFETQYSVKLKVDENEVISEVNEAVQ